MVGPTRPRRAAAMQGRSAARASAGCSESVSDEIEASTPGSRAEDIDACTPSDAHGGAGGKKPALRKRARGGGRSTAGRGRRARAEAQPQRQATLPFPRGAARPNAAGPRRSTRQGAPGREVSADCASSSDEGSPSEESGSGSDREQQPRTRKRGRSAANGEHTSGESSEGEYEDEADSSTDGDDEEEEEGSEEGACSESEGEAAHVPQKRRRESPQKPRRPNASATREAPRAPPRPGAGKATAAGPTAGRAAEPGPVDWAGEIRRSAARGRKALAGLQAETVLERRPSGASAAKGLGAGQAEPEFLVKLKGMPFRDLAWVPLSALQQEWPRQLASFLAWEQESLAYGGAGRGGRHSPSAGDSDAAPLVRDDWAGYLEIERIISCRAVTCKAQGKAGAGARAAEQREYLVKWARQPYACSTWESEAALSRSARDVDALKAFWLRGPGPAPAWLGVAAQSGAELRAAKAGAGIDWGDSPAAQVAFKDGRKLREYQKEGVNWMFHNFRRGVNSILADEMGLGKTLQSVALLECVRKCSGVPGPFLVVAPVSTLGHWQRELDSLPGLYTVLYAGSKDDRDVAREYEVFHSSSAAGGAGGGGGGKKPNFDVLLTSFEILLKDRAVLANISWQFCIVDEAHRMKSGTAKTTQALKGLSVRKGGLLLLSGTPVQNNTKELFGLLNLLDPIKFGSADDFMERFGEITDAEQVRELQEEILQPRLLRRMKEDVEGSIPSKEEVIIWVELTPEQRRYYKALYQQSIGALLKGTKNANLPNLRNLAMELRKLCNHPFLCNGLEDDLRARAQAAQKEEAQDGCSGLEQAEEQRLELLHRSSGKMALLDKLLPKLRDSGHRVLIFSQFVTMLDLLEEYLERNRYSFERIDGGTPAAERQAAIDRYSAVGSTCFAFLLSTKAGGLGITLTAADTCIIYDSDWNPQNDLQAMARCHRIGQSKDVKIYRLITHNTYEEQLFETASRKYGLEEAILGNPAKGQGWGLPGAGAGRGGGKAGDGKDSASVENDGKEIERLLRKGAYDMLKDENVEESAKFSAQNIDQILEQRTQTRTIGGSSHSTFSVAKFCTSEAAAEPGQGAPSPGSPGDARGFWETLMPEAVAADEAAAQADVTAAVQGLPRARRRRQAVCYSEHETGAAMVEGGGSRPHGSGENEDEEFQEDGKRRTAEPDSDANDPDEGHDTAKPKPSRARKRREGQAGAQEAHEAGRAGSEQRREQKKPSDTQHAWEDVELRRLETCLFHRAPAARESDLRQAAGLRRAQAEVEAVAAGMEALLQYLWDLGPSRALRLQCLLSLIRSNHPVSAIEAWLDMGGSRSKAFVDKALGLNAPAPMTQPPSPNATTTRPGMEGLAANGQVSEAGPMGAEEAKGSVDAMPGAGAQGPSTTSARPFPEAGSFPEAEPTTWWARRKWEESRFEVHDHERNKDVGWEDILQLLGLPALPPALLSGPMAGIMKQIRFSVRMTKCLELRMQCKHALRLFEDLHRRFPVSDPRWLGALDPAHLNWRRRPLWWDACASRDLVKGVLKHGCAKCSDFEDMANDAELCFKSRLAAAHQAAKERALLNPAPDAQLLPDGPAAVRLDAANAWPKETQLQKILPDLASRLADAFGVPWVLRQNPKGRPLGSSPPEPPATAASQRKPPAGPGASAPRPGTTGAVPCSTSATGRGPHGLQLTAQDAASFAAAESRRLEMIGDPNRPQCPAIPADPALFLQSLIASPPSALRPPTASALHPPTAGALHPPTANALHPPTASALHPPTASALHPRSASAVSSPITAMPLHGPIEDALASSDEAALAARKKPKLEAFMACMESPGDSLGGGRRAPLAERDMNARSDLVPPPMLPASSLKSPAPGPAPAVLPSGFQGVSPSMYLPSQASAVRGQLAAALVSPSVSPIGLDRRPGGRGLLSLSPCPMQELTPAGRGREKALEKPGVKHGPATKQLSLTAFLQRRPKPATP